MPRVSKRKAAEVVENTNGSPESEGERAADVILAVRKDSRTRKIAEPKTKAKAAAKVAKTLKVSKTATTTATSPATTKAAAKKGSEKAKPAPPAKTAPVSKAKKAAAAAASKKAADERVEKAKAERKKKGKKEGEKEEEEKQQKEAEAEETEAAEEAQKEKPVEPPRKKGRVDAKALAGPKISALPTRRLNVYAFGTGDNAELGLGPEISAKVVKRPRLNAYLLPDKVGVVAVAIGGMHGLALTHEGKVYSWGVNDQYALGRETKYNPPVRDASSDDDSDSDAEEPLNPMESTPMPITTFPEKTVITNIAAGDSISIAVTDTGKVYGWGTFRCSDGILGFNEKTRVQETPVLLSTLKNIVQVSVGTDHVLALTKDGNVYAWGNGQQFQLGRRVVERTRLNGLIPREFGLPRRGVTYVATGSYHSFAITGDGRVWAWGLNQFGQCGIFDPRHAGEDNTVIPVPTVVQGLLKYKIVQISAGEHHSAAVTEDGELLVWGRLDGSQLGLDPESLPVEDVVRDVSGKPRYLTTPRAIPDIKFSHIGCGTHHNIAISEEGQAYSWGFGGSYQTGLGPVEDEIKHPTKIENTATKGVKMVFSAAGGQFSVLTGIPPAPLTNGTS